MTLAKSILFVVVSLSATCAFAADPASSRRALTIFAAGGRSLQNWHGQATFESLHFEWAQPWRWKTQLAFDVAPYSIRQPRSWFGDQYHDGDETVRAISATAIVRRTFRPDSMLRPYLEIGTGPMVANRRVPAATSHFNMATQAGFGVILLSRDVGLYAGYRFWHVSNGGLSSRNPGWNVNGIVIGSRLMQ